MGYFRRMKLTYEETRRSLYKWLNRRSQRPSMKWRAVDRLMERFQIPRPRIVEKTGQKMPCQQEFSFCQRLPGFLFPRRHPAAIARASGFEEPGAGKLPAGICAGVAGQPATLPRQSAEEPAEIR